MTDLLTAVSLYNGHPKFLGYVTSSPAPVGMLADLLAAAVNPNVGAWTLSPVATEIEAQTIRWIAELLNYPPSCSGVLVSGGNMANLWVFIRRCARFSRGLRRAHTRASRPGHRLRLQRNAYLDREGDRHVWPSADALQSIRVDCGAAGVGRFKSATCGGCEDGRIPVAVIGSAGTVSTGAIDPLPAMANCREHKCGFTWMALYGGFAAMVGPPRGYPGSGAGGFGGG